MAGAEQIEPLLHSYLLRVAAPGDALAARWAVRAMADGDWDLVAAIDARLEATKLTQEGRVASRRCGGRILLLGAELFESAPLEHVRRARSGWPNARPPGHRDGAAGGDRWAVTRTPPRWSSCTPSPSA